MLTTPATLLLTITGAWRPFLDPMDLHDAWVLLHRLMQFGLIVHVTQSRPVIDGAFYYRFTGMPADEGADPTEP